MCITIVYGAYELMSGDVVKSTPQAAKGNPTEELRRFITDISSKLVNEQVGQQYQYMVEQAGMNWNKDPFIQSTDPLKQELKSAVVEPGKPEPETNVKLFVYSGFLQAGNTKLAIINGMEYGPGDALGNTGYYLKHISIDQVVINKLEGLETIRLPLKEIDSGSNQPNQLSQPRNAGNDYDKQ